MGKDIDNVNGIINENIKLKLQNSSVLQLVDPNYTFESFSDQKPVLEKPSIELTVNVKEKNKKDDSTKIINYQILYKLGDDLRNDFYIIQSFDLMNEVGKIL